MPYFNILNYIQLELIKRQRRGELSSDQEKLIHTTINGIATGLRNSGWYLSNFLFFIGEVFEHFKKILKESWQVVEKWYNLNIQKSNHTNFLESLW